jgi:hypothetical protein
MSARNLGKIIGSLRQKALRLGNFENNAVYFGTNADTSLWNRATYLPKYDTSHSVHCNPCICRSETLKSYKQNGFIDMSTVQQFVPSVTRRIVFWYKSANISKEHASVIMETESSSETSVKF